MFESKSAEHQRVIMMLAALLLHIEKAIGGCGYIAPLDVYLDADNVVQPDALWIATDRLDIIGDKRINGAPDLVIEVLSPGLVGQDRRKKFRLYEQHGVREYWMIDLVEKLVDVWQLDAQMKRFLLLDVYSPGETFSSGLVGAVTVDAIFG